MSDNPSFEIDAPDHFTAGAIGPPGQRVFYLQSREAGRVLTLKVEKEHVRALAEYLGGLLARVKGAPSPSRRGAELLEEAGEEGREEGEEPTGPQPAMARFRITRGQAAALVERAGDLMKGGRPSCPICSRPMDPEGHVCPRSNGHVVH